MQITDHPRRQPTPATDSNWFPFVAPPVNATTYPDCGATYTGTHTCTPKTI